MTDKQLVYKVMKDVLIQVSSQIVDCKGLELAQIAQLSSSTNCNAISMHAYTDAYTGIWTIM